MPESVPLNIAMVSGSMPPMHCGVGDNALMLARALADRGHRVTVYTHQDADALEEHHLTVRPLVPSWNWAGCHALTHALVLDDPDIIHLQYPTRGFGSHTGPLLIPTFLRVRHFRGPIVTQLHEFSAAHWLRRTVLWPLLNESDGIAVSSHRERERLLFRHRSLNDRPLRVAPVGPVVFPGHAPSATSDEWAATLAAWGVPADAFPVLISYGFVRGDKGLETLARAVAEIQKGTKVHVVHIGPWNPAQNRPQEDLLNAISNALVIDRFHFVDYQPLTVLPATPLPGTVGIFPYRDGISDRRSAAITLGWLGYPLITTISGDGPTDAKWGEQALLVPPDDPSALAQAIKGIGTAGVPTARPDLFADRYSWGAIAAEIEDFYSDVLDRYRVITDPGYVPAAAAHAAHH
ncbi:MAG TPA: glycosyltransferase family 4 protein [bacterium]|nr:glycosyltransferase family 4 protein [bacterium]